jgi:hypothetical protein
MVSPRIREVCGKAEMDKLVDDFMTQGFTIKEEGSQTVLLKKKSWGSGAGWIVSIVVALLLSVLTFGFSFLIPIAYAIYAHYTAAEVLLRIVV